MRLFLKQDPEGRDDPSPVSRPDTPGDVDAPAKPRGKVRDVNVSAKQQTRALDKVLRSQSNKHTKELFRLWERNQIAISNSQIKQAIKDGCISDVWVDRWVRESVDVVNNELAPLWGRAIAAGGSVMREGLIKDGTEATWQLLGESMETWVRRHAAETITNTTEAQRRAINLVIQRHTTIEPIGSRSLERLIRPLIGLTQNESSRVSRIYKGLIDDGTKEAVALARAKTLATGFKRKRARRIARTELASAYNRGTELAVREAFNEGAFATDEQVVKVWFTQEDERVCPFCGPLHGVPVTLQQTFPGQTRQAPNVQVPPAHPMCRCVILYEVVKVS